MYKKQFEKLNVNNTSKELVYIVCANYIDELIDQKNKAMELLSLEAEFIKMLGYIPTKQTVELLEKMDE